MHIFMVMASEEVNITFVVHVGGHLDHAETEVD